MTAPKLSLIIPALNESEIIVQNIDELAAWMVAHDDSLSFEVLVIDDGSTDGMGELLEEACTSREWLRVIHHPR